MSFGEFTDNEGAPVPALNPRPGISPSRWCLRWQMLVFWGCLGAALVVLFLFNPARHSTYPFCIFHWITGLQCPGCGGLRAMHHLLHGEVALAFRFNPMLMTAGPVAGAYALWRLQRKPRGRVSARAQGWFLWAMLGALLLFWIARNLPLACFKLPDV